jgi:hypothetical protein
MNFASRDNAQPVLRKEIPLANGARRKNSVVEAGLIGGALGFY